ncbi:GrpB family protein [Ruegeria aquimaris]|uniref:GrpB family protein n=1 Tax=Ruegeria aquimaris TaxID=2984333 RepID=A0ABT3AKT0_9RHOB|nr:GrpB family protein [Ruegeria sp. XHP0148]MCV2889249.1 GrpB family protein [Ruegeria sp. XHP0148]
MSLLAAPDPHWPAQAQAEAARWRGAGLSGLVTIHHIGSTAVPGLPARPVLDLLAVFADPETCDAAGPTLHDLGYERLRDRGPSEGRRLRLDDPETGAMLIMARCLPQAAPAIARALAFRDALTRNAPLRAAYTAVRARCAARHPDGGDSYDRCKAHWIDKTETRALEKRT